MDASVSWFWCSDGQAKREGESQERKRSCSLSTGAPTETSNREEGLPRKVWAHCVCGSFLLSVKSEGGGMCVCVFAHFLQMFPHWAVVKSYSTHDLCILNKHNHMIPNKNRNVLKFWSLFTQKAFQISSKHQPKSASEFSFTEIIPPPHKCGRSGCWLAAETEAFRGSNGVRGHSQAACASHRGHPQTTLDECAACSDLPTSASV